MSAKKPKAPKLPDLAAPPAITDPNVRRAESEDRLARRKGALASIYAGHTNRRMRPELSAADVARRDRPSDQVPGAPDNIDLDAIRRAIATLQGGIRP
jgi:hypothetical protein